MKSLLLILLVVIAFVFVYRPVIAQEGVVTSTLESPVPVPDTEPTPIPETLLQLILELVNELGGWLTGALLGVIGIAHKGAVSWVRRRFPNDEGTATKINGGVAQIFSGLTAIVLALITFGIAFVTNYATSLDLGSLIALAGTFWTTGYTVHKADKLGKIARGFALLAELKQ